MLIPIEKLHRQYFGYGLADYLAKIDSVEKRIELLQSICKTMQQMNQLGGITLSDIFAKEEE